jgi:gamma-glutamyltranspeptidase/glutathione hydrolase
MTSRRKVSALLIVLLAAWGVTCLPGAAAASQQPAPNPPGADAPAPATPPPAEPAPAALDHGAALNTEEGTPAAATPQAAVPAFHRPPRRGQAWVVAANPMAVEAGLEILRRGGSAVDAAVAVQAMLGLVEPQSSGIGGGAFLMYYDARSGDVSALDGREKAPAGASPTMFLDEHGKPLSYIEAVRSGRSTGVPGVVAMLYSAHARYGALRWGELFQPAIRAASDGFKVPPRMASFLGEGSPFPPSNEVRTLFSRPDGGTVEEGDLFRNPDYAATLGRLALEGPPALYAGSIASELVKVTTEGPLPGAMTLKDLAGYHAEWTRPLCRPYRHYSVCVPPPPAGGVSLLELLGTLEKTDIASREPNDPQAWFLFAQASRLMYADRDRYLADPHFVIVPVERLLDPGYLRLRAQLIGERAGPAPQAGNVLMPRGRDATQESSGTSHFVVVDADGNVVSMTTTVESVFGSGRTVGGFVLNNQLTDFSFAPTEAGLPAANAVQGGKRPRSSMSPIIILDHDHNFVAALGSPGGSAILEYNAKAVVGVLAWKLPLKQAIELPNLVARGDTFTGELAKFSPAVLAGLRERGIVLQAGHAENSGFHGVLRHADGTYEGAADSRREGVAGMVVPPRRSNAPHVAVH